MHECFRKKHLNTLHLFINQLFISFLKPNFFFETHETLVFLKVEEKNEISYF